MNAPFKVVKGKSDAHFKAHTELESSVCDGFFAAEAAERIISLFP